jgi:hypothetical protein
MVGVAQPWQACSLNRRLKQQRGTDVEKIIVPVWKLAEHSQAQFCELMHGAVSDALLASGVHQLRVSLVDEAVAPAAGLRQENLEPMMDGVISFWVDSYIYRQQQFDAIAPHVAKLHAYLVTESAPMVPPAAEGERTEGMCQIAFLCKPAEQSRADWLDIWHNSHTQVAIDTQSTFGYRQNVIAMALTEGAPHFDAIVEEHFPAAAMDSPHAFYDAFDEAGKPDDAKLGARVKEMIDSCARFIDFSRIVVLPTSEYTVKR